MRWVARILFVFLLVILGGAFLDAFETLDMLGALAELAQRPDAIKDFQVVPTSLLLALGWGLFYALTMTLVTLHFLVKLWPYVKRQPRREVEGEGRRVPSA